MRAAEIDLFCLPCAGASASMYLRWRREMPSGIRVLPLELPGRGARLGELFIEDFADLVDELCERLISPVTRRWALFGHSMGGLLAYGVVQRLQSAGESLPERMIIAASPSPFRRDPDRYINRNDDEALIADLREQGGTPQEVFDSPELLRITLDALAADYRVCDSFHCPQKTPLAMPLHVLAGRNDSIESHQILAWQEEAGTAFSLQWFDGGHFFIREHETSVLRLIRQQLQPSMESRNAYAIPA